MKTKQVLFHRAHFIAKSTKVNFSLALKKAWAILKLAQKMKNEVVEFAYKKVDGSIRVAKGLLVPKTGEKSNRPFNTSVQSYFDIDVQDYRCFKIENLIANF